MSFMVIEESKSNTSSNESEGEMGMLRKVQEVVSISKHPEENIGADVLAYEDTETTI